MEIDTRRLVKSRSNGKIIAAALEFLSSHIETLVITPGHSAGEELAHLSSGLLGAHRMTLVQLAADLARPAMSERGLAPLSALGLEALAARVAYAARGAGELTYFEPVSAFPGFSRALARTLGELRLSQVDARALAESGAPGGDLARLLGRYQTELEERSLADLAAVFQLATEAAAGNHRWIGLPLLWLDVPLDWPASRELFRKLAARSPAVLVTVSEGERELQDVLEIAAEDLDTDRDESSLEHLRANLFSAAPSPAGDDDSALEMFSAPGEGLEAVEIARRIQRFAREGMAFDQMAVLLRAPDRYQPVVEEALRRARIPACFSRGTARPDPGGRALLALLACAAEKCSASRFAEYLSLGQVPPAGAGHDTKWVGAEDELLPVAAEPDAVEAEVDEDRVPRAPAGWEKLLVDAAVIGGQDRWERRLKGLEHEIELRLRTLERDDASGRDHLTRHLTRLTALKQFALPVIAELSSMPAATHWNDWLDRLAGLARLALRHPEPVLSVLAEFEPMGEVGPASLEEVADVLGERLRFLRREPPQRRYGRVFIGVIEEARGREFEVVFVPGLAEGLFPQRALEDPLLLDQFRTAIGTELPLREDRTEKERLRLRLAVAATRGRLIASYPRMDGAEARPRVPSFYALELPRAVKGRLPELKEFERLAREAAPARLNWPAPRQASEAIDDAEYDLVMLDQALTFGKGARYLVETNDALARTLRARWKRWAPKWTEADGLVTGDASALTVLAGHRLNARPWSSSALQQFAVCPYKFALNGIFGLRPRDEPTPIEQMDPLTRGGLFHAVQFALLGELRTRAWLPVSQERLAGILELADHVLDKVAAKYAEDLVPAIPRVWTSEIEDLRTDLRGWLQHVASHDSEWEPIHFEFGFGLTSQEGRDPASTASEAQLDGCGLRLRGSIDLVERHIMREGVLRVTDHKTGKPPEMTPAFVGGGRFLQPLLYSLAAEQLLHATVESGRLFYATQQGGYQHAVIPTSDRARQFLGKLLTNIDTAIVEGFLPPAPQKDACGQCDYRIVCGPYEELRVARYKDRRDERLDVLTEIRGMA